MGVRQVDEKVKVFGEISSGVPQRSHDQDTLLIRDGIRGGLDRIEVDMADGGRVDLQGGVVVKYDRCL
jgi:hypothetical protein